MAAAFGSLVVLCVWALGALPMPAAALSPSETVALVEMQTMADAEELVFVDTGFFVSLENLDDISVDGYLPAYNFIGDGGGTPVIDPATARFQPNRRDLLTGFNAWGGPYVTYQPGRTDRNNVFGFDPGTPLDPWGGLYYLFTPAGLVRPPLSVTLDYYADQFDLYAIVSFGPDGAFGGGDDMAYTFGLPPTALTLTSISPLTVRAPDTLDIKGYNFGTQGGGVELLINGSPVTNGIISWQDGLIQKRLLASDPAGAARVSLRRGAFATQEIAVTILPAQTAASTWWLY
jgi:hypothetical protein